MVNGQARAEVERQKQGKLEKEEVAPQYRAARSITGWDSIR